MTERANDGCVCGHRRDEHERDVKETACHGVTWDVPHCRCEEFEREDLNSIRPSTEEAKNG